MNSFERWLLKKLLKKLVRERDLTLLFHALRIEVRTYWTEDNRLVQEELIKDALYDPYAFPLAAHIPDHKFKPNIEE